MTTPNAESLASGRFQLLEVLGVGGMATVYRAFDRRLQRFRAIKILAPALAQRESLRKRFLAEAQTMATLEESRVVRVFDMGEDDGRVYIVMELVEGGSLVDRVNAAGPLPPQLASQVALQIAESLHVAHLAGVIHRDIKPHNILLTRSGEIRITDFGIAQVQSEESDGLTRTGAVMGTWGFMAPEQRSNAKTVDARADVFSTGATLWSLLKGDTPPELYAEEDAFADLPETLVEVLRKATRYRREERYASALALADALREVLTTLPPDPEFVPPLVLARTPRPVEVPSDGGTIDPSDDEPDTARPGTMVPDLGPDPSLRLKRSKPAAPAREATELRGPAGGLTAVPVVPVPIRPRPDEKPPARTGLWVGIGIAALALGGVTVLGVGAVLWQGSGAGGVADPAGDPVENPADEARQFATQTAADRAADEAANRAVADALSGQNPGIQDAGAGTAAAVEKAAAEKAAAERAAAERAAAEKSKAGADAGPGADAGGKPADAGGKPADVGTTPDGAKSPKPDSAVAKTPDPEPTEEVRVVATALQHAPPASMPVGGPVTLSATGGSDWGMLVYYRPLSGGQYNQKVMVASGTHYAITIKDAALADGVEYFIKATTPGGPLTDGSATKPHRVTAN